MKQLFAFSILFCLVFLNVPRSFVHDCDDHGIEHNDHNNDDNHNNDLSASVDNDSCFICEFDLGFFNVSDLKIPAFAKFFNYAFISPSVDYISPDAFFAFSHRGPPLV
jgi:hypothetical protein